MTILNYLRTVARSVLFLCGLIMLSHCGTAPEKGGAHVMAVGACERGHLADECVNRTVCRIACSATAAAAASKVGVGGAGKASAAASGQVCAELCELMPECSRVFVCDEREVTGL